MPTATALQSGNFRQAPKKDIKDILRSEEIKHKVELFALSVAEKGSRALLNADIKKKFTELGLTYADARSVIDPQMKYHMDVCGASDQGKELPVIKELREFYKIDGRSMGRLLFECLVQGLTSTDASCNRAEDKLKLFCGEWSDISLGFPVVVGQALAKLEDKGDYVAEALLARQFNSETFPHAACLAVISELRGGRPDVAKANAAKIGMPDSELKELVKSYLVVLLQSAKFYFEYHYSAEDTFAITCQTFGLTPEEKHQIGVAAFNTNLAANPPRLRRADLSANLGKASQAEKKLLATQFLISDLDGIPKNWGRKKRIAKFFRLDAVAKNPELFKSDT